MHFWLNAFTKIAQVNLFIFFVSKLPQKMKDKLYVVSVRLAAINLGFVRQYSTFQ